MTDDLERRLSRVRPVGPPPDLRARIASAAAARPRFTSMSLREWTPVAAAILVAVVFSILAAMERQAIETRLPPVEASELVEVPEWR